MYITNLIYLLQIWKEPTYSKWYCADNYMYIWIQSDKQTDLYWPWKINIKEVSQWLKCKCQCQQNLDQKQYVRWHPWWGNMIQIFTILSHLDIYSLELKLFTNWQISTSKFYVQYVPVCEESKHSTHHNKLYWITDFFYNATLHDTRKKALQKKKCHHSHTISYPCAIL